MADFYIAHKITTQFEGGYVHDKIDRGGETFKGIARKFHPDWQGWSIVDTYKKQYRDLKPLMTALNKDKRLQVFVDDFYIQNFWNRISGHLIKSQKIANVLFDSAVNHGIIKAVKMAQSILDVVVDGMFGMKTLNALNASNEDDFVTFFCDDRVDFYNRIVEKNPTQSKYLKGWLRRANAFR